MLLRKKYAKIEKFFKIFGILKVALIILKIMINFKLQKFKIIGIFKVVWLRNKKVKGKLNFILIHPNLKFF